MEIYEQNMLWFIHRFFECDSELIRIKKCGRELTKKDWIRRSPTTLAIYIWLSLLVNIQLCNKCRNIGREIERGWQTPCWLHCYWNCLNGNTMHLFVSFNEVSNLVIFGKCKWREDRYALKFDYCRHVNNNKNPFSPSQLLPLTIFLSKITQDDLKVFTLHYKENP